MQITQADFRTVRLQVNGVTVLLRCSLEHNGDERLPESIACREAQSVAYFLTATIRDYFRASEDGLTIQRTWSVLQEGRLGLSFCLDFQGLTGASCLIPGAACGEARQAGPAAGELSALPNALYLIGETRSVALFTDPPRTAAERGSVELARLTVDDEPYLRVEIRFPPRLSLPRPPRRGKRPEDGSTLPAPGGFERSARLHLVAVPAAELFPRTLHAALTGFRDLLPAPELPGLQDLLQKTRAETEAGLDTLLVREGGVCGLRLQSGSPELSASAGALFALVLQKLFPEDPERVELALELVDFALKGQLPSGWFYELYHLPRSSWLRPEGRREKAPEVRPEETAATARSLLELAGLARRRGLPHARCLHAAERAVEALTAAARSRPGEEAGWLALVEPLSELVRLTGRDAHKKLLAGIKERLFADAPGPAAAARQADAEGALHRARAAVALGGLGFKLKGVEGYFHSLLPWLYLNGRPEHSGGLLESLGGEKLGFRGWELGHLLVKLDALAPGSRLLSACPGLLPRVLGFTLRQPAGTSGLPLSGPRAGVPGPQESRLLARELNWRLRFLTEHRRLLERRST